jgi:hypothetical protein
VKKKVGEILGKEEKSLLPLHPETAGLTANRSM